MVIDSIVAHFRDFQGDYNNKRKTINRLGKRLTKIAKNHHIALIVTDNMQTTFTKKTAEGKVSKPMIEPYMPDLFRSLCSTSIELSGGSIGKIVISKSPMHAPSGEVDMRILKQGIEFLEAER